jgi:hypothetical protein
MAAIIRTVAQRRRGRQIASLSLALTVGLLAAGVVMAASGGSDPSSAPNMSLGSHPFSSCNDISDEFWGLPGLGNDDQVTLNVNGTDNINNMEILPPSTTDYNWENTNSLDVTRTSGSNKMAVTFVASEGAGRYLVYVDCRYASGAYDFVVASVVHAVRIDVVPRPRAIQWRGTFTVRAINGDGGGISDGSLTMNLFGGWGGVAHKFGVAAPSGGNVAFHYALPAKLRGKTISLWVTTRGNDRFQPASTDKISVSVR